MPGTYSKVDTVVTGDTIAALEWNTEHDNHISNFDFSGLGDYSASVIQMQSTADPYPGSVESLATNGRGELERIRYLIKQITGKSQWYIDPDSNLSGVIVSGTKMLFFQAAAPTGWTKLLVDNDKVIRVVSGTGGGGGGSAALSSAITLAHTHTVASHTHSITAGGAHDHGGATGANVGSMAVGATLPNESAVTHTHSITAAVDHDHSGAGGTAPGTDSQLSNITLSYIDIIAASKD